MKKDINKEEELLKTTLSGIENSFTVPENYFEELPSNILSKIESLPDFEKNSVVNPFIVPDHYFDQLSQNISEKVVNQKSGLQSWLAIFQRPRIAIPVAFAAILLLAGIFFYTQKNNKDITPQQISADDLKNSTYIQSMDEELFVDVLAGQIEITTDDSLEQYLIDNNIELSQIANKL